MCDRCGVDRRPGEVREDRQKPGLVVCKDKCWDPRHPQEFVRATPDNQRASDPVRPPPIDDEETMTFATQEVTVPSGTFNTNTL